ncbi:MAG: TlyA family RNA methyltransferase [Clostridia bacterium]|nr:TlyA family RNA methyltransferase [Clostridia bacterium]
MRIDAYLAQNGLCKSRERARILILQECVKVNGITVTKPSFSVTGEEDIQIHDIYERYVGRGGFKLEKALDFFQVNAQGATVLDIGASTGGFTDCWLQHGAAKVYALDVGNGQLAPSLLEDERVVSMENTDARVLDAQQVFGVTRISVDVSFISLTRIFPVIYRLLPENGMALALIKPQFEAGRQHLSSHGVVKSKTVHVKVLQGIVQAAENLPLTVRGMTFSPLKGGDGNIEYWIWLTKDGGSYPQIDCETLVEETFDHFKKEARL